MPEHVTVATVRVRDDRFTCVTMYDVPRDRLDDILDAFEERGPWADTTVLAALREGIEREVARGDGAAGLSDAALLNGPQLPANANSQDDIDALLASFD